MSAAVNATVPTPADPAAPPPAEDAPLSFEATAEDGVIHVPPEWRAKLGSTCRVRVTVPAAELVPAAEPAAGSPPFPEPYPPPELVAAHPDWEWASRERLASLMPKLPAPGEPIDLGPFEGTPMGELMRNPLSTPDGRYLTREERNER